MTLLQVTLDQTSNSILLTIILSVIGSGALSTLISLFVSRRMKTIEYKYDYRKYILQKRQLAYEDIEQLIVRLGKKSINTTVEKPLHRIFMDSTSNENPLHDFNTYLTDILNQHVIWVTKEIHDKITDLLNYLGPYYKAKNEQSMISSWQFIEMGIISFDKIELLRLKICTQFFKDIKELDDINKFKKSKRHF